MDSAEEKYAWKAIDFKDVKIGKRIGGGGVGIIYQGQYRNCRVALKTLVCIPWISVIYVT